MNGLALCKPLSLDKQDAGAREHPFIRTVDLWWIAFAATLIPVSLIWDFSWESSIGVDRFWSPPHLATHMGVWLSGLVGVRLIYAFTCARHRGCRTAGVNVGPFCGPAGAWILVWSAVMLQAALLSDNWWQRAYGLGAGLWHPPQILKATGFFGLLFGALVLGAGTRSKGSSALRMTAPLLGWHGGLLVVLSALVLTIANYPNLQHTASFYLISCAIYPAILLTAGHAVERRWGATNAALAYITLTCAMVWILPVFPAHPLTAPIHNPTDRMMPPAFPLLLAAPALVIDLLRARFLSRPRVLDEVRRASVIGIGFFAVFLPIQWFFASFLLSPSADNWFFAGGGRHWPFFLKIDQARVMFWGVTQDPLTWRTVCFAMVLATVSAWLGLRVAVWLSKLRR